MAKARTTPARANDESAVARTTPARKPRARRRTIRVADVAERAYFRSLREPAASPEENWLRAEQELLAS